MSGEPADRGLCYGRDAEAEREHEETFTTTTFTTTVLVASGMPKMMSRVLTCLTLTDAGSLTTSELLQHLRVSPASISEAIAYLESQGLIRRERDDRRRERCAVDNGVWCQSMMAGARATAHLVETARQGVGILGPDIPVAARLESIARFLGFVSETRAAGQAREILHADVSTSSGALSSRVRIADRHPS